MTNRQLADSESSKKPEEISAFGRERPLIYEWLGEPIILNYMTGPARSNNLFEGEVGEPKAHRALFLLREVSALGVVVSRIKSRDLNDLGPSLFIPWSAVHYVRGRPKDEEAIDEQEGY